MCSYARKHPDAPMAVKPPLEVRIGDDWPGEGLVDLAGEVALQAAQDVFGGQLFSGPAAAVGAGSRTGRKPGAGNHVQGAVGLPIAAARETMASRLAAGCRDWVRRRRVRRRRPRNRTDPVGLSSAVTSSWAAVSWQRSCRRIMVMASVLCPRSARSFGCCPDASARGPPSISCSPVSCA
jgi:hypothetical protein